MKKIIFLLLTFVPFNYAQQSFLKQDSLQFKISEPGTLTDTVLLYKEINFKVTPDNKFPSQKTYPKISQIKRGSDLLNISTRKAPENVVITKENYAYVNSQLENCIQVVDLNSKSILKTIYAPFPEYIYYNALLDEIYIVNFTDTFNDLTGVENCYGGIGLFGYGSQITIIDAPSMNVKDSVKMLGILGAERIFPSKNENIFYVKTDGSINIVDLKNKTVIKTLYTNQIWGNAFYDKNRDRIYMSLVGDQIVYWDLAKDSLYLLIEEINATRMWFDEGGDRLFTEDGNVIDLGTGGIIKKFPDVLWNDLIIDTLNNIIIITQFNSTIILDSDHLSTLKNIGTNSYKGKIAHDGKLLCLVKGGTTENTLSFIPQRYEIQLINLEDYQIKTFSVSDSILDCSHQRWIDVSPDNKYLVVTNHMLNSISIVDISDLVWGTQWTQLNNGLTNKDVRVLSIDSNNNIFAGTYGSGVFRSTDNGNNWTDVSNGLTNTNINCLAINSSNQIFAGTDEGIFHSTNNGDIWEKIDNELTNTYIGSIAINPNDYIFIISGSRILRSMDNGNSWNQMDNGLNTNNIISLSVSSNGNIFVGFFLGGGIFRSTDNGDHWIEVNNGLPTGSWIFSISIIPDDYIFIYLFTSKEGGIYHSTDNGDNWSKIFSEVGFGGIGLISSLITSSGGILYAGALGDGSSGGSILYSSNNGENWEINSFPYPVNSLEINSNDIIFAATNGGGVYSYLESTISVRNKINDNILAFSLEQNYPNPFNPTTKIKYSVPQTSFVKLKVYDILGKEVASLVNEEKSTGNYEVKFNGSNLTSGVYFYRIQAGSFTDAKKFILVK